MERKKERNEESDFQIISEMAYTNCHSHSVNTHSLYCILSLNLCVGRSFHSYECALVGMQLVQFISLIDLLEIQVSVFSKTYQRFIQHLFEVYPMQDKRNSII